jgi:hypothetical protein
MIRTEGVGLEYMSEFLKYIICKNANLSTHLCDLYLLRQEFTMRQGGRYLASFSMLSPSIVREMKSRGDPAKKTLNPQIQS